MTAFYETLPPKKNPAKNPCIYFFPHEQKEIQHRYLKINFWALQ